MDGPNESTTTIISKTRYDIYNIHRIIPFNLEKNRIKLYGNQNQVWSLKTNIFASACFINPKNTILKERTNMKPQLDPIPTIVKTAAKGSFEEL